MSGVKDLFPVFKEHPRLAYLDNAATTQKPYAVTDRMHHFEQFEHANVHRGLYPLSNAATQNYEAVRRKVADFIGATRPDQIAFTKGATESLNVVARSFLASKLSAGDNVVVTIMEHHANFIPWQLIAKEKGAEFRVAPIDANGNLDLAVLNQMMDTRTKMVVVTHFSNTLGTLNPIDEIITNAHKKGIPVVLDAAQSASLYELNVKDLGVDFMVFSAHKVFGPFGVGVLYTSPKYQDEMQPYNYGGGMVEEVHKKDSSFLKYPYHLDAGTVNVSGVIGLGAAIDFVSDLDRVSARANIAELTGLLNQELNALPEVRVIGQPIQRGGILSFTVKDIHPHEVASFLGKDEIAVRAGTHCTQPLLDSMGIPATVRASFSIYNTSDEVVRLVESLKEVIKFWL